MKKVSKLLITGVIGLCFPLITGCNKNTDTDLHKEGRLSIVYYPGGYGKEYLVNFCKEFLAQKKGKTPSEIVEGKDFVLRGDQGITYGADYWITSDSRCPDVIISNYLNAKSVTQGYVLSLDSIYNTSIETSKGTKTIREYAMKEAADQFSLELRRGQTAKHTFAIPWTAIPISVAYNNTLLQKIPHTSSLPVGEGAIVNGKWNRVPETIAELKACFADAEAYDSRINRFGWAPANGSNWLETLMITWWAQRQGVDSEHLYPGEGSYYDFWAYESANIFKQTGLQDALSAIQDLLVKDGKFANSFPSKTIGGVTIKNAQEAFAEGKVLFCLTGDFFEKEYEQTIQKYGQEFKMMRVPSIDGAVTNSDSSVKKLTYLNVSSCAYIPTKAANKDLAKEFLTYTCQENSCVEMSKTTGAIRPFDYDMRDHADAYASLSTFKKSVFDMYYEADDYLVKYPRNVATSDVSPIYLYEGVSECIYCGATYSAIMTQLLSKSPNTIMVTGDTGFESIYSRAVRAFKEWNKKYK